MNERMTGWLTAAACLAAAGVSWVWWFGYSSGRALETRREPPAPAAAAQAEERIDLRGQFETFDGKPSTLTNAWPRFRGAAYDNVSRDPTPLADRWPAEGPPVLWSVALGEGYAGAAVWEGRVYVMDYDEARQGDALRCFSLDDGREIWRRWYRVRVKRNHGMSRTVPAVADGVAVAIGPRCHVLCVDARSGDFKWGFDLAKEFGAEVPMWYTGQCPLVEDGVAVLVPAGRVLALGVDVRDGRVLWQTPNPRGWRMSHASPMPVRIGERRLYAYCAIGGIAGIAADGPERGALLWETAEWNHAVVAPSPVPLPDGRLFVTAGYGAGSRMLRVRERAGAYAVESLFALDRRVFACEQHTPVYYRGHLFGVLPADAGANKQQLVCLTLDGAVKWTSGVENRYGLGPFMIADDKLLVLEDNGRLTLAAADPDRFVKLAEARVLHGVEAWAPLALAGGRLLARDRQRMVCLDLRAQGRGGN